MALTTLKRSCRPTSKASRLRERVPATLSRDGSALIADVLCCTAHWRRRTSLCRRLDPRQGRFPWRAWVSMRAALADAILEDIPDALIKSSKIKGMVGVSRTSLVKVCEWLTAKEDDGSGQSIDGFNSFVSGDPYKSVRPIFTQVNGSRPVSGYSKLKPLRPFHAHGSTRDYRDDVYAELMQGNVVIVDLHLGPDSVTRQLSENLAARILERQTETFTSGADAPRLQVVLEEAHNLFGAQQYKDDFDVWVRLAKEASKLNVGMVYATQEVSGVAHQVLANTKNWVVARLNNTKEVNQLSQFYDFRAFSDAIISQEDRGYVRLKTMSSPYIIPVQIDRYGLELVNEARAAAGNRRSFRRPGRRRRRRAVRNCSRFARAGVAPRPCNGRVAGYGRACRLPRPRRAPQGS